MLQPVSVPFQSTTLTQGLAVGKPWPIGNNKKREIEKYLEKTYLIFSSWASDNSYWDTLWRVWMYAGWRVQFRRGLIIFFVLGTAMVVAVDRLLVTGIKPLSLSLGELLVGIVAIGMYYYDTREIEIDISTNQTDFFVVAFTQQPTLPVTIEKVFPFDKYIRVPDKKYLELNQNWQDSYQINLTTRKSWESITSFPFTLPDRRLKGRVYSSRKRDLTTQQIDSLIKAER